MERKGLLSSRLADPTEGRGGRPRRYVGVTPEGMEAARAARTALLGMWEDLEGAYDS